MASKRDTMAATLAKTIDGVDQTKVDELMQTVGDAQKEGKAVTLVDAMVESGVINKDQGKRIQQKVEQKLKSRIGDFEILKKLGEGGMGAVYRARQISMDRPVALKLLSKELGKNKNFVDRFIREARASARIDHPNVVRGYAVGEAHGLYYFAMEFIDGESVQDRLDRDGRLDVAEAVRITGEVARALVEAEKQNMVHRDIKPDNIMITKDGRVKLADLGLAKRLDEDSKLTQTGAGFGTPYYMPPEQAKNAKYVDGRSDIYALGATLYHMVAGEVPFTGETPMEVLTKKEEGKFPTASLKNEHVDERLNLIIDKMMAVNPDHRHQTAEELLRDLEATGMIAQPSASAVTTTAAGLGKPAAKPKAGASAPPPKMLSEAPDKSDIWHVRFQDTSGRPARMQADTQQIRKLIRDGMLNVGAKASRKQKTEFRPLEAITEFRDLMQARVLKAKSDRRTGGEGSMATRYAEMEKEYRRKKLMKKLWLWAKGLITLIILAVIGYVAYIYISEKLQGDAAGDQRPPVRSRESGS